ncbi:MAG: cupin domain-containing protein [Chloroflexi bacterium]|nr:cupin domain-containing protein [Chloroflexota bacterium]
MVEKILERKKEPEPQETLYDRERRYLNDMVRNRAEGQVVIKGKGLTYEQGRQGLTKFYTHRYVNWDKIGVPGWSIFVQRIHKHSGKHIHQGGLCIFVLDGKGYTVVDGQRYDWEEGDLIVLPIKPGGVEHQHFNVDPNHPAEWMAYIYETMRDYYSVGRIQVEDHPDWGARPAK